MRFPANWQRDHALVRCCRDRRVQLSVSSHGVAGVAWPAGTVGARTEALRTPPFSVLPACLSHLCRGRPAHWRVEQCTAGGYRLGRFFGDDRGEGNILHSTPQCEENPKHRIERHIGGPGFDLGNAWLARLQLLGYLNLSQVLSYAVLATARLTAIRSSTRRRSSTVSPRKSSASPKTHPAASKALFSSIFM